MSARTDVRVPVQRESAEQIVTPTGRYVGTFEAGSEAWHEARRLGVGGSEIAPILGFSPFESRFSLWHRKKGTVPPLDLSGEMEWGHRCEPMVAAKYADEHPEYSVVTCGTYSHRERPWQVANPDRLLVDSDGRVAKPLEIKYSLFGDGWGKGPEEIPPYYRTQALWYIDTLGLDEIDIAVFIGGSASYREYTIKANVQEQEYLREQARTFLDELAEGDLPEIDGHDATYQAIKELHPEIDGESKDVPLALARDFINSRAALDEAKAEAQMHAGRLADHIGNGQYAYCNGKKIASRQVRENGTPYLVAARNLKNINLNGSAA